MIWITKGFLNVAGLCHHDFSPWYIHYFFTYFHSGSIHLSNIKLYICFLVQPRLKIPANSKYSHSWCCSYCFQSLLWLGKWKMWPQCTMDRIKPLRRTWFFTSEPLVSVRVSHNCPKYYDVFLRTLYMRRLIFVEMEPSASDNTWPQHRGRQRTEPISGGWGGPVIDDGAYCLSLSAWQIELCTALYTRLSHGAPLTNENLTVIQFGNWQWQEVQATVSSLQPHFHNLEALGGCCFFHFTTNFILRFKIHSWTWKL